MRPSYASSSEMYTHMGTMPRPQKKKDKTSKVKTKTKSKSSALGRSQSMRCSDHVIESPLLSALNAKTILSLQENQADHQKTVSRREPETLKAKKIHNEKTAEDPDPPLDALQEKHNISVDLQEENRTNINEQQKEDRKTCPDNKSDGESNEAADSHVPNPRVKTAQGCSCPSTVHHKDAMRNCALSMDQIQEMRCPLSPVGETPLSPAYTSKNKPLEMGVLKRVKELLAEVDPKTAATHITNADCTVARILGVTKEMQRMMGVGSGLELLTLPHGHQLRLDLLERFYTMSIMMAVDLLGCTGNTEERAALLYKTIQLAAELKSTMGNMFGFAAIMRALELPQISRLEQTWMTLRQRHTEGAVLYEKKLKPFMKNLNESKESSVLSSTTFPHVVPVLCLMEKGVVVGEGPELWDTSEWGVDVVMSHLEAARSIAHHGGLYRTNAESKLHGTHHTAPPMRLLWGSRGSEGSQSERYEKFDKVLTALSHKLEPPVRHSEL
ncbi:SH2 domain-containing protein 3C [Bagarius yarrelli]|uniref:SH2 domain-containing protein 3C n=1 Tax=Bagarius yarrelli TaxID=175774 RepID=A0A556VVM9_BAGYA|nr:SH2 domain-containing protein 3C [Bagarius yarrelli]